MRARSTGWTMIPLPIADYIARRAYTAHSQSDTF
jgi:hypothetical protein